MIKQFIEIVNKINNDFKEHSIKSAIAILVLAVSYLLFEDIFLSFILGISTAVVLLGWDSRFFIGSALIFLVSCPILLTIEKEETAEQMAVCAYYMLVLGVILQIIEYFKESFLETKEKRKIELVDFWGKRKVIAFVLTTTMIILIVFAGCFWFLHSKINSGFIKNEEAVRDLIASCPKDDDNTIKESVVNQKRLSDKVIVIEQVDWESVKVLIGNSSGQEGLGEAIAEKFAGLGLSNAYIGENEQALRENTLIEHCENCSDIARELIAALRNPDKMIIRENPSLTDEIRIGLGTDQAIIKNKEISVSVLNGSGVPGAARELGSEMNKNGFTVVNIGDAERNDYQKSIIKYASDNLEKANMVKEYLSAFYNDPEVIEDLELQADVEIILGRIKL